MDTKMEAVLHPTTTLTGRGIVTDRALDMTARDTVLTLDIKAGGLAPQRLTMAGIALIRTTRTDSGMIAETTTATERVREGCLLLARLTLQKFRLSSGGLESSWRSTQ